MISLFRNVRFYVLTFSLLFSLGAYYYVTSTYSSEQIQIIRLQQIYALTSVTFLYFTLLAGPLCYTFKFLPFRGNYLKARRALGVSAFYFGLLHGLLAFFGQLGGFEGLGFLSSKYLLAITLSFTALVILTSLALTAFDFMIDKLGFSKWKLLHRFVYLAGVFILIHALMLGSHFQDLSTLIPQILFIGLAFLFLLEALRFDAFLQRKFSINPQLGITFTIVTGIILTYFIATLLPKDSPLSLGIHAQHIQLAKDLQSGTTTPSNTNSKLPGLDGDRNKRYTVDFDTAQNILPNQEIDLNFAVFDASSGNKTTLFKKINGKVVHLIIVNSDLTYFDHIHPEQKENLFTIKYKFPKNDIYHLYLDFQPIGAIEQQIASTINIGNIEKPTLSSNPPDNNLTKTFGNYEVTLAYPKPLKSNQISIGQQALTYTIKDASTKNPITNLKPYLEAFGHLVMINQQTFEYVHVHPRDLKVPAPDANGGPKVEFIPIGIYGPIKPGTYKVFAQFNPDNQLFTSDFIIKIE